jgi:hypothetical protein
MMYLRGEDQMFKLRFANSDVPYWAGRYSYPRGEAELLQLASAVRTRGYVDKPTLQLVADWKSPRSAGNVEKNAAEFVEEMTSIAFAGKNERSRIEPLTLLDGVSWPTASVVLHLFHPEPYPILDFRALWSLGSQPPAQYGFDFWWPYVQACRQFYDECACDPRTFDRAVWQYSKEQQGVRRP